MTAQVLFFDVFSEKDPQLNAIEPGRLFYTYLTDIITFG